MSLREYKDSPGKTLVCHNNQVFGHLLTCCVAAVNDNFILYLLEIIEGASDDAEDPYHYPVIRVLVCENTVDTLSVADRNLAGHERAIPSSLHQPS